MMENGAKVAPFYAGLPQKKYHTAIRKAVDKVLDELEDGAKFSGSDLPKMCAQIEPLCKNTEGETIRRYMRYYRSRGKGGITCIDRQNSIYMKTPVEDNQDECLGELFAAIDKDDRSEKQELKELRTQVKEISNLLGRYGVPDITKGKRLSLIERVEIGLKKCAGASV